MVKSDTRGQNRRASPRRQTDGVQERGSSTEVQLPEGLGGHAPSTGPARTRPHPAKNLAPVLASAAAGPSRARVLCSPEGHFMKPTSARTGGRQILPRMQRKRARSQAVALIDAISRTPPHRAGNVAGQPSATAQSPVRALSGLGKRSLHGAHTHPHGERR